MLRVVIWTDLNLTLFLKKKIKNLQIIDGRHLKTKKIRNAAWGHGNRSKLWPVTVCGRIQTFGRYWMSVTSGAYLDSTIEAGKPDSGRGTTGGWAVNGRCALFAVACQYCCAASKFCPQGITKRAKWILNEKIMHLKMLGNNVTECLGYVWKNLQHEKLLVIDQKVTLRFWCSIWFFRYKCGYSGGIPTELKTHSVNRQLGITRVQ